MSSLLSKLINLAGNITGTLGISNGGTGQVTANAAFGALSPMTTRGDMIRQGASAAERFAAVTNNQVIRGNGTDVVSGQIDDPGFFTTGAAAGAAAIGIVTTGTQTFAGAKTLTGNASFTADFLIAPASLANASSTILGQKEYFHGTTYSGGNAPTVTLISGGGTLTTVNRAVFIPYQMQSSTWRMRFNMNMTVSSTLRTGATFGINGVTFQATVDQEVAGGVETAAALINSSNTTNNTSNVTVSHASAAGTAYLMSGDVELASKPTWAF